MKQDKACRSCRYVLEEGGDVCPICGSNAFTTFWRGYVVVINPENSELGKKMGISAAGKYALHISR